MQYKTYSFSELIKNYEIAIPMIQRDYAQGRQDKKVEKIRDDLLKDIKEAIQKNKDIKLDFVYGYLEKIDSRNVFIPLDGQQRLTTLFLLHWYVAAKLKVVSYQSILRNFLYETRTSSTDFISSLVNEKFIIPNKASDKKELSEAIKNSPWFFNSWEYDPTITAILIMLDSIHKEFNEENLSEYKLNKIKFDFINMEDFGLGDDLYLKMNARGLPLTPFEKFKSSFKKILEDKKFYELEKEFTRKIDNDWLDTFWKLKYIENDPYNNSPHNKEGYQYKTIDKPFMRFFWYMTEIFYFKKGIKFKYKNDQICDQDGKETITNFEYDSDSIDEKLIGKIYGTDEVKYLFKVLDDFAFIHKLCGELLSAKHELGKVTLFKKKFNLLINLLKPVSNEKLDNQDKLILFSIVNYVHQGLHEKSSVVDNHLHDLVRVIRNLLIRVRKQTGSSFQQLLNNDFLNKGIFVITSLTDEESAYKILQKYKNNISLLVINEKADKQQESINTEIKKTELLVKYPYLRDIVFKLEDDPHIKGAIHNFMPEDSIEEIENKIEQRKNIFYEIWSQKCHLIVRSLLSLDAYQVWANNSNLDGLWFFGNEKDWEVILTYYVDGSAKHGLKNKNFIVNFLQKYHETAEENPFNKLNKIINDYLTDEYSKDANLRNWRFYFIKYENILCEYSNIYSWGGNFNIRSLCGNTLHSYHINPYIKIVWDLVTHWNRGHDRILTTLDVEGNSIQVIKCSAYARFANRSPLSLVDNVNLFCEEKGWKIEPAWQPIKQEEKFNLVQDDGYFYLKPTKDKDMIEIAVEFISELYQLENLPEQKESEISSDFSSIN